MRIETNLLSPVEDVLQRFQIQLALSRRVEIDAAWRYDFQSPFWRLYVNSRFGASIIHQQKTISLMPGRIYLIPAWVCFETMTERPVVQHYLHYYVTGFPPSLLRRIFDQPILLSSSDQTLKCLCHRWQEGFERELDFAEFNWASALAHAAVAVAMESLSKADQESFFHLLSHSGQIGPALEAIDQSLATPLVNSELAGLCNLSTDHFIRQFRRIIGMTPAQYGIERRIAIAAQWLTGGERTIDEIADAAGFTDRFHFSRSFKTRLGIPPGAYRKLHQQARGG